MKKGTKNYGILTRFNRENANRNQEAYVGIKQAIETVGEKKTFQAKKSTEMRAKCRHYTQRENKR